MSENLVQDLDFIPTAQIPNIRGVIYSGVGSPNKIVMGANTGAIYVDQAASQLWFCINAGTTADYSWIPYGCLYNSSITIASDVQEGQLVGIFGPGAWSVSGNLNVSRKSASAAGTQGAAWISAGCSNTATSVFLSSTELFNGSTWAASANLNISRCSAGSLGSQNAGLITGGAVTAGGSDDTLVSTELLNGTVWAASASLNFARADAFGSGTQNAALVGGNVSQTVSTETFNGSSWLVSSNMNTGRDRAAGTGSQNSALVVAGSGGSNTSELFNGTVWINGPSAIATTRNNSTAGGGTQNSTFIFGGLQVSSSEIFNGTSWSVSGRITANFSNTITFGSSAGSQNAGLGAGGLGGIGSTIVLNGTEFHNKTIYRSVTYRDYPSATNIGIAVNVTNSAITASLIRGVLPSNIVSPYYQQSSLSSAIVYNNQFFGLTKFNNDTYPTLGASLTAGNVISLSATNTNQLQISLTTNNNSLSNVFFIGMLLSITNAGTGITSGPYPVVGGTYSSPIIRDVSAVVTGGESLKITPLHGKIMSGFTGNITTTTLNGLNALNITLTNGGNMSLTAMQQTIRIGDIIRIPYGSTVTTGSFYNYGPYQIQLLSTTGNTFTATAYQIRPLVLAETGVQNIVIASQIVHSPVCLDDDSILLGLNSRVNPVPNPGWDDSANGAV